MTVFFFGFIIGSPLLIGLFLGLGSLWAMIIDIPLGTIQKYFTSKSLIISAFCFMLLATLIFLYFVYTSNDLSFSQGDTMWETTKIFFDSAFNVFLLLLISILYGTAKELYEVSELSYLLNLFDPSEYAEALSKNNIAYGVGAVVGIVFSVLILSFKTEATQLVLFMVSFFIVCAILFVASFFDNPEARINLSEIKDLRITKPEINLSEATSHIKKKISTGDFEKIKSSAHYVLMKPKELHKQMDYGEMKENTRKAFGSLLSLVVYPASRVNNLLWLVGGIFIFGFWDTVVVTFFVTYIAEVLSGSGGDAFIPTPFIVLGLLAIPAYALQFPCINASKKYGHYPIITMGLIVSAAALFCLAIFGQPTMIGLFCAIVFGMLNSAGYAAGFPLSQSVFAEKYNEEFARRSTTKVIDSDVSAGPLKILNNFANAIGLMCAGALISWFGYRGMFFAFGIFVTVWAVLSVIKKESWKLEDR